MLRDYSIENLPNGRYFGKRYLQVGDFIRLCDFVGLRSCSEYELESYEEKRIMFPAARTVMPEEYARAFWQQSAEFDEKYMPFHRLDSTIRYPTSIQNEQETDWRHPIDKSWGSVDGLKKPSTEDFTPWDKYIVDIPTGNFHVRQPSAMHFYHYWQIYELYDVRRSKMEMYKDNIVYPHLGSPSHNTPGELSYLFEASSYFHVLFSSCHSRLIQSSQTNNDGLPVFSQAQDNDLRQTVHNYAIETRRLFDLNEDALYKGLRQMMNLHFSYEEADRFKLSSALSMDIGWLVELISHSFNMPTEEISRKAGSVGGYTGNYLELLFPNRKKEVREKSICVLWRWSQEHNRRAPNNSLSDIELTNLLNYTEKTDIAWFEYVIADLNKSFFGLVSHNVIFMRNYLNLLTICSSY